ncbi:MAG: molybdenum cofactor guanylyltransferase [Melioribacteraceae bacterium]
MKKRDDITAVILNGGKSSRMGTDKSLLKISGDTLIGRAVSISQKYFASILVSSNEIEQNSAGTLKYVKDIYSGLGPISGIHSGLVNSKTEKIFVYSADIVFGSERLINEIIEYPTLKQIVLPLFEEIPQYTFGIYSKSVLPVIEEMLKRKDVDKPTPKNLIKKIEAELIDFHKCIYFEEEKFINLNTPADYERAKLIFEKGLSN